MKLWFLRRFRAFREMEAKQRHLEWRLDRAEALPAAGPASGSLASVEAEVERALLKTCPIHLQFKVESVASLMLGWGEVRVLIQYGGRRG